LKIKRLEAKAKIILIVANMSGIEAVGLVLGLWPIMIDLVNAVKAGKTGSSTNMLRMNILVQEKIFKQSIQKLLQGDEEFSDKDKMGLIRSNTNFAAIWMDPEFVGRLERRLDDETLAILKYKSAEISKILTTLRKKIEKGPEEPIVCFPDGSCLAEEYCEQANSVDRMNKHR
jgi:hypothetical protein